MPEPRRVAIVTNESYFAEFAESCERHLHAHGYEPSLFTYIPEADGWNTVLVIGIHKYLKLPLKLGTKFLGIQTEQLPLHRSHSGRLSRNLKRFEAVRNYYDMIFEWNPCLVETNLGGSVFVPYGCIPKRALNPAKHWDFVFIGNMAGSQRRHEMLDFLGGRFNFYPDFSPGFGERKDNAINGSKICLNIHYYDNCGFESPRMFDYLSRGAFVLSERAPSTKPFTVGHDFDDLGDKYDLVAKLDFYLKNKSERERIADNAYVTASTFDYQYSARVIAQEISKLLESSEQTMTRLFSWGQARALCGYMELRDYLSVKRRNLLTSID